jgi:16S rRNA (guanine527-N7)-methyltransferase
VNDTAFAGVEGLVERYSLPAQAGDKLMVLLTLLVADPHAATAVRGEQRVLDDHLADSLVALSLPVVRSARSIADLGAGPGLPGLALAIARPDAAVTLLESNGRKCSFIERAAAACGLPNARVVNGRVEAWREGLGRFALVTARALGPLDVVAEYAAPLLRVGGALVAWRGERDHPAEGAAARAAAHLGLAPDEPLPVVPYPRARSRHLHLMSKVSPTPAEFPRRTGMARKRPLGGRA